MGISRFLIIFLSLLCFAKSYGDDIKPFDLQKENKILKGDEGHWMTPTIKDPLLKYCSSPYPDSVLKRQFEFMVESIFPQGERPKLRTCEFQELNGWQEIKEASGAYIIYASDVPFGLGQGVVIVNPELVLIAKKLFKQNAKNALNFALAHELAHFIQDDNYVHSSDKKNLLKPAETDFYHGDNADSRESHAEVDVLAVLMLKQLNLPTEGAALFLEQLTHLSDKAASYEASVRLQYLEKTFTIRD